jgi:hypothetical protein
MRCASPHVPPVDGPAPPREPWITGVAKKKAVHGEGHIRGTVDYAREGRKSNFDEGSGPQA